MQRLTITSVNPTTDTLTITGHGLTTGDGRVAVYTPDGSLPGGLSATTSYWVIRVDADNIKLASSSANALDGIPVNISSAGSGTLQLLHGLPYRRRRTYVPGSQVSAADFNDIFGSLEALWNLLTGQSQSIWSSVKVEVPLEHAHGDRTLTLHPSAMVPRVAPGDITLGADGTTLTGGIGVTAALPIPVRVGDRIKSVSFPFAGTLTGNVLHGSLERLDEPGSGPVVVGTSTDAPQLRTITVASPVAAAAGQAYSLVIFLAGAGTSSIKIGPVTVVYDRPVAV